MDHREIELDALRALTGAETVQRVLMASLGLGEDSIESLAYVIKCRIKNHESLVAKILDRRKKGKLSYKAQDATDIIGLRLLALFRNELPTLVHHFLNFLQSAQHAPFNLFAGPDLASTIKEIIIYRSTTTPDVTDVLIAREFERVGFTPVLISSDAKPDETPEKAKIVIKPTEYSSIHIVIWCTARKGAKRTRLPMEVQIRTALEDVWGEIDHRLKYKIKGGDPSALNEDGQRRYALASDEVTILKRQLDGCGLIADNIFNHIQEIFTAASYQVKPARAAAITFDVNKLLELNVDRPLKGKIKSTVELVKVAHRAAQEMDGKAQTKHLTEAATDFLAAEKALKQCISSYAQTPSHDAEVDKTAIYYLGMEHALCLLWIARLQKLYGITPALEGDAKRIDYLELALREYLHLYKDGRFSKDPILSFRIANALDLRGDAQLALDMYREAVENLREPELASDHPMRIRIPRFLGIALWDAAEDIRRAGQERGSPDFLAEKRRQYYLQAIDVTKEVVDHPVSTEGDFGDEQQDARTINRITKNNVVEYAVCYLEAGGSWSELSAHDVSKEVFSSYLKDVVGAGLQHVQFASLADTIRKAANLLNNGSLARDAAKRVKALLRKGQRSELLSSEAYREMIEEADRQLRNTSSEAKPAQRKGAKKNRPAKQRRRPGGSKRAKAGGVLRTRRAKKPARKAGGRKAKK